MRGFRSGSTFYQSLSRFKLFAKAISRRQKSLLAMKELEHPLLQILFDEAKTCILVFPIIFSLTKEWTGLFFFPRLTSQFCQQVFTCSFGRRGGEGEGEGWGGGNIR